MSTSNPVPHRIAIKFFVASGSAEEVELGPFIPLFHRFIQEQAVLGLLVDVADYAHVPEGPGVILIGHDVDYAIDSTGGRPGLLTTRKHYALDGGGVSQVFRDTLGKALVAICAIEEDGSGGVVFDTGRIEIQILDRLAASADASLESLSAELNDTLSEAFGKVETQFAQGDPRRAPALVVSAQQSASAAELCERLAVRPPQREGVFEIGVGDLKQLRDRKEDFVLIDVREPSEYETCNLAGELIPLGTLADRLSELDKSAHVIVHCKSGPRGAQATSTLRQAGFENAWNLKGGILAWIDEVDPSLTRY